MIQLKIMGTGGMNFIHNAYDFYQKPEIQIPLQTVKLAYQLNQIYELTTQERCYMCINYIVQKMEEIYAIIANIKV